MFVVNKREDLIYVRCGTRWFNSGFFYMDGVLIDCGPTRSARAFRRFLKKYPVTHALFTHHHEDHSGNAAILNEAGITPFIHPMGVTILQRGLILNKAYRRILWGTPERSTVKPLPDEVVTPRHTFQVIKTPGHTIDHVCFYEPEKRYLFTGDLFLSRRIKYLGRGEQIGQIIESLEKVIKLDVRMLFCAHAGPINDGAYFLREKLSYIRDLADTVRGLSAKGTDLDGIQKRLKIRDHWIRWISRGDYSTRNLIEALLTSQDTLSGYQAGRSAGQAIRPD